MPLRRGVLSFEDATLELMPLSSRRALDHAGLKLSLAGWQGMKLDAREALCRLGTADAVDTAGVRSMVQGATPNAVTSLADPPGGLPGGPAVDPPATSVPPAVASELRIDVREWAALSPYARFVLQHRASRGRHAELRAAYHALRTSSGVSQSDRRSASSENVAAERASSKRCSE